MKLLARICIVRNACTGMHSSNIHDIFQRLFSLQSRISCSVCGRALFRHELNASSASIEDQFFNVCGDFHIVSKRAKGCNKHAKKSVRDIEWGEIRV